MLCVVECRGVATLGDSRPAAASVFLHAAAAGKRFMSKLRSDTTKLHRHLLQAQPESASMLSKHRDRFPDGTQL